MLDPKNQNNKIKNKIDVALIQTFESTSFTNDHIVKKFASSLA
jgi:hypothetical protein